MKNTPVHYHGTVSDPAMHLQQLFTVHYFEHFRDYPFCGESHDFWEMIYVGTGEITVIDELYPEPFHLQQGQLLLLPPNSFHEFRYRSQSYIDLFITSFSVSDPAINSFIQYPLHQTTSTQRNLIVQIIMEARRGFLLPLSEIPLEQVILLKEGAPYGCIKMIQGLLELLLIQLYREVQARQPVRLENAQVQKSSLDCVSRALVFLKENLYSPIRMEDVCRHVGLSTSQLQKNFSAKMGHTVMGFLAELRIEEAKFLIRQQEYTFTEIAEKLCFCSVHHFSRRFKQFTTLTPSEYARSLDALMNGVEQGAGAPRPYPLTAPAARPLTKSF